VSLANYRHYNCFYKSLVWFKVRFHSSCAFGKGTASAVPPAMPDRAALAAEVLPLPSCKVDKFSKELRLRTLTQHRLLIIRSFSGGSDNAGPTEPSPHGGARQDREQRIDRMAEPGINMAQVVRNRK
jgi:hypothetical protein